MAGHQCGAAQYRQIAELGAAPGMGQAPVEAWIDAGRQQASTAAAVTHLTVDLGRCRERIAVTQAGMAQKVTVTREDDLAVGPAAETVRFGLGAAEYEIDLSKKNARAFRRQLAPVIEHARKAGRGPHRRTGRAASNRERSGDIRTWAKTQGIAVSDRGRIPASVIEQYRAATKRS
jgi:hypothetical protein